MLRWFGPPPLPRPEFRRRARTLWMMSWPLLGVVATILAIAVIVEPTTLWRRATTVGAVAALMLVLHAISRSGRPVLASWILVIGLSAIVTQRAWITGGIHAPVAVFYALFIIMGGLLLDARGGFVTAVACLFGAIVLTAGTATNLLTPRPGAGSALGGFVFVVLTIGMASLVAALVARRPRQEGLSVDDVSRFVHDMRSPMQVVLMHLDLLRTQARGEALKDVEGAFDGARTLNHMTDALLDISLLEAGRVPVRRMYIDLGSLSRNVIGRAQARQPKRNLSVNTQGDVICNCDMDLTQRILENLVTNAMMHTEARHRVLIDVTGRDSTVEITVHDEGTGVSSERQRTLFERFRADTPAPHKSAGLGLAFCRLAAEAQGASIRYEDRKPRGSSFILTLPR